MSNLLDHAKVELEYAGLLDEKASGYDKKVAKDVLALIKKFSEQGQGGLSASLVADLFNRLCRYQILTPLTEENADWQTLDADPAKDTLFQSKRCSHVFKVGDRIYDIQAVVFVEPNGAAYTDKNSVRDITFPYVPKTEFIDVDFDISKEAAKPKSKKVRKKNG